MRAPSRRAALFLVFAAACCVLADACTSSMFTDPNTKETASWRLMDFPEFYFNQIAWVPKGTTIRAMPVGNSSSKPVYSSTGPTYTTTYSYACVTSTRVPFEALVDVMVPGAGLTKHNNPGVCTDGMNTASLAVACLMQDSSTGIREYNGTGPAVEQFELVNYLLANYATVAEVKAALQAGTLNVVHNPAMFEVSKIMFNTTWAFVHYVLYDKYNQSLVIEFSGPTKLQWFNNTLGSLANNPLYEDQVAFYKAFAANSKSQEYVTFHDSLYYVMPGAFNSSYRFTKSVMLKLPASTWNWTRGGAIQPGYVAKGVPSTNPNLMTNIGHLNALWLPKGVDDAGGIQGVGMDTNRDITILGTLRDHANADYYYRVANNPMWKRIALNKVKWPKLGGIKYAFMKPGVWWQDVSYNPNL